MISPRRARRCTTLAWIIVLAQSLTVTAADQPRLLRDVNPAVPDGSASADPIGLASADGVAYFYARDDEHGYELWVTDGTVEGTRLVKDINPGPEGSALLIDDRFMYPPYTLLGLGRWDWSDQLGGLPIHIEPFAHQQLTVTDDGIVYFYAYRPVTGAELWRSDGTDAGTFLVKDILPGQESSSYGAARLDNHNEVTLPMVALGNRVYFSADDGVNGPSLWVSDGTEAGTRPVAIVNINHASFTGPHTLATVDGKVFFAASDGVHGYEPWLYDPATDTARMLIDINLDAPETTAEHLLRLYSNGIPIAHTPLVAGGRVYFFGALHNYNFDARPIVFVFDPAEGVVDIAAGLTENGITRGVDPALDLVASGGKVYFAAFVDARSSLMAHDPAAPWPNSAPLGPGIFPRSGVEVNGTYFFAGLRPEVFSPSYVPDGGWELWASDGTRAGTAVVQDLNPGRNSGIELGLGVFETAVSLEPRWYFTNPSPIFSHGGRVYLPGTTSGTDSEDPTPYRVSTGQNTELFRNEGTSGVVRVAEIEPGPLPSSPRDLTRLDATRFVFSARTGQGGRELWVSDGTQNGTVPLRDIARGDGGSAPREFTEVPGRGVFFAASIRTAGAELWRSEDATGAQMVRDINPGSADSKPSFLTAVGDRVYFGATDGELGFEIYSSDGTEAGTALTRDVRPGPANGFPLLDRQGRPVVGARFAALNGRFLFMGDDGSTGRELYISDGTAAGTRRLRDISLGPLSSLGWTDISRDATDGDLRPPVFTSLGGTVFFSAIDGASARIDDNNGGFYSRNRYGDPAYPGGGGELWRTDGTGAGTQLAANVNPATVSSLPLGSDPRNLTPLSNASLPEGSLVFYAQEGWVFAPESSIGRELYAYDASSGQTRLLRDINPLPVGLEVGSGSSYVDRPMAVLEGVAYFAADDGSSGVELWRTDGTPGGTLRVADLNPGPLGSDPGPFAALADRIVFQAADSPSGEYRLWAFDGLSAPAPLSEHVHPVRGPADAPTIAAHDGRVYFAGYSDLDNKGVELYSTDGTPGSVRLEADLNPGPGGSLPRGLRATSLGLFFSATDGTRGLEPWVIGSGAAPACPADFDGTNGVQVADVFAFLRSWFAGEPRADFDGTNGIQVADVFAFLRSWFAGCP